jgi:hypothetical protein
VVKGIKVFGLETEEIKKVKGRGGIDDTDKEIFGVPGLQQST